MLDGLPAVLEQSLVEIRGTKPIFDRKVGCMAMK